MSIGCAHDHINNVSNSMKRKIKYYKIKHHISGTIHFAVGYFLCSISTYVSLNDQIILFGIKAKFRKLLVYQNYQKIQYMVEIKRELWVI